MGLKGIHRVRAALSTRFMTDAERAILLAAIEEVAPGSTLMANPAIAASYAALTTKGAALATNVSAAAAIKQQLVVAGQVRDTSRSAFDLELIAFKSLVEANAVSAQDLSGMGLSLLSSSKASRTLPDPPVGALVVKFGRAHGKATVTVPRAGNPGRFVAEVAVDPAGPWTSLPGTGRQRKLTGASGAKVWVRFAAVRFGLQSEWCTPVLVTLP